MLHFNLKSVASGARAALPALLLGAFFSGPAASEDYWGAKSTVAVQVTLISADLSLRPVPKQPFVILRPADKDWKQEVTTSFQGDFKADLFPGPYVLKSAQPVRIENKAYTWEIPFRVVAGVDMKLELSNDNAKPYLENADAKSNRLSVAGDIYQRLSPAVAVLETDDGHGTAFLADERGLFITNEHVVSGSKELIISLGDDRRYPARLVFSDATNDIAVVAVNPAFVAGVPRIVFAKEDREHPAVSVGDPVLTIGNPGSQRRLLTSGLVSEIRDSSLITDVTLDHGSSGGPLLNSNGEAVGVTTFGQGRTVAGTVRAWRAAHALEASIFALPSLGALPDKPLPAVPSETYPAEAMRARVLSKEMDLDEYGVEEGDFMIMFLTPPARCYFEHYDELESARGRERHGSRSGPDPVGNVRKWSEEAGQYRLYVRLVVMPLIKATAGSKWGRFLVGTRLNYEFSSDLAKLGLRRAGAELTPFHSGRFPIHVRDEHMNDSAFAGYADFPGDVFDPAGGEIEVRMTDERDGGSVKSFKLGAKLRNLLWRDLSAGRAAPAVAPKAASAPAAPSASPAKP